MTKGWEEVLGEEKKKQEEQKKKLKEEATKEKKPEDLGQIQKEEKLIYTAQEVLGRYLAKKFENITQQYPSLRSFIEKFAPFVIQFSIAGGGSYGKLSWVNSIKKDFFETLSSRTAEGYIKKTDLLYQAQENLNSGDFIKIFPEYANVNKQLCGRNLDNYSSPLDIVMIMTPEKRPIIAVASQRFMDKNQINPFNTRYQATQIIPDLETLIETAKEFDCHTLTQSVEEFNKHATKF